MSNKLELTIEGKINAALSKERAAYLELKEAFMHLLKLAVTIGEAENLTYNFKDYPSKRPAIELAVRMGWIKKK